MLCSHLYILRMSRFLTHKNCIFLSSLFVSISLYLYLSFVSFVLFNSLTLPGKEYMYRTWEFALFSLQLNNNSHFYVIYIHISYLSLFSFVHLYFLSNIFISISLHLYLSFVSFVHCNNLTLPGREFVSNLRICFSCPGRHNL